MGSLTPVHSAAAAGQMQTVQLLLASPNLTTKAIEGAAKVANDSGHADLAIALLRALMSRDKAAAVTELKGQQSLAAEVLKQWQASDDAARGLEARWPALQHLLLGIIATQKQLRAAAADITATTVSAAVQAATPVGGNAAEKAVVVGATSAAAMDAVAAVAPLAIAAAHPSAVS